MHTYMQTYVVDTTQLFTEFGMAHGPALGSQALAGGMNIRHTQADGNCTCRAEPRVSACSTLWHGALCAGQDYKHEMGDAPYPFGSSLPLCAL